VPEAALGGEEIRHENSETRRKRSLHVDDRRGEPLKKSWVGFVEQAESLIKIPTIDIQQIVDWILDDISGFVLP
jgi:hypothetical protein